MSGHRDTARNAGTPGPFEGALAEFIQLHLEGKAPDISEFCRRHGDPSAELRQLIEDFLRTDREIGPDEPLPESIPGYNVISLLGEGGMGTVYSAEESEPIRRRVALKLIRKGMDSRAILGRFNSERQALAMMDHPNIARVYDAGTTEDGRPYFSMEYVDGIPLTQYCDQNNLPLLDRLKLFIEVCHGVQHAHQKAVMHRDLKPSNILVTNRGNKAVPIIIDFGLAKALGGRLTNLTNFTEQGVLIGTPEYLSPEQANPDILDIDTRTDIYSLGVILYYLLAGDLPIEMSDHKNKAPLAALEAIRQDICEKEPKRPSTRVESSEETLQETASHRRLDPSGLIRHLQGDLDWIAMKALEKDRTRRYATALDLVRDIERHLQHEPVLAGPPSVLYLLRKFVKRNKTAVGSLAFVILTLVTGGGAASVFYLKSETALREKEAALKSEGEARLLAESRREDADRERQRAVEAEARERKERNRADALRAAAESQTKELLGLSDVRRYRGLRDQADRLWPAHPDNVNAMEAWLADTRKLARNLEEHQTSVLRLRKEAVSEPQSPGSGWAFSDFETKWHHDFLAELVEGLGKLLDPDPQIGHIANVNERLLFARSVRELTIDRYKAEWNDAVTSIANEVECPAYKGLEIKPQIGLVPLGRDRASGLWEFAHLQTGEIPTRDQEQRLELREETSLVFVLIPTGTFLMGSQEEDPDKPNYDPLSLDWEGYVHRVTVEAFFMSKYEATQGQWEHFTKENPSHYQSGELVQNPGLHPVEWVSYEDCNRVLSKLGLLLPSEAQWEYAARGGTETVWWTGNDRDSLIGAVNLADQTAERSKVLSPRIYAATDWPEFDDGYAAHAPIGTYRANPFGLHEVLGNVWEWTLDALPTTNRPLRKANVPRVPRHRIIRGGSFCAESWQARSTYRLLQTPSIRAYATGFRPCRVIDP